jgi:hypothetical protein
LFKRKHDLEKRATTIPHRILKAEERYIEEDFDKESFLRYKSKCKSELAEIMKEEQQFQNPLLNLKKLINFSTELCHNLSRLLVSEDLTERIKFPRMLFPGCIESDRQNITHRTQRVNTPILCIAQLAIVSDKKKTRNSVNVEQNSARVAALGIEPKSRAPETLILSIVLRGHSARAANICL